MRHSTPSATAHSPPKTRRRKRWRRPLRILKQKWVFVLVNSAAAITLGLLVFWFGHRAPELVRIASMRNGETIMPPTTLAGTASQLRRGHHLGLAACFPDQRCFIYFDQDIIVKNGEWSAPQVMFGEQGDA